MSEDTKPIRHIVVTPTKSVGTSLILTILFGPLGLLYSTTWGGIIMIVLSLIVGFVTLGFGLLITWPVSIIWGALAVSNANKKIMNQHTL